MLKLDTWVCQEVDKLEEVTKDLVLMVLLDMDKEVALAWREVQVLDGHLQVSQLFLHVYTII